MRKFLLAAASTVLATGYSPAVTSRAFASGARGVSRSAVSNQCMSATLSKPSLSSVVSAEPATHPAFELVRVDMVDEYTIKAATYRHTKSGAEIISAQADDDNKVFGVVFRTPVKDSTGVPHVLEHSVLCGSDKYTSKEPFVELLKGSLQTFLNAFTYPDRTCYPVASQNTKDFYNLVNVYLDAVLHPRAKRDPTVLAQEGWHYELEDAAEPLTFKGVVFNEMKGVYSSPESRLYRASQQTTFPDNTYAVDSGGDPEVIPNLSFEQFKSFHDSYYHPANGRFFFYGDDAPLARLELLDEYLQAFDAKDVSPTESAVATQKLYAEPWKHVEAFPAGEGEDAEKHMVMVNWLLHEDDLSDFDQLALGVLDHLLMGTTTAPLYQAMLSSGLGTNVMGGGLSDELKQATFSVGLKGVEPDNVAKVEELALTTLQGVAARGFGADEVEASMNTIEFQLRECNTGGFPKGLSFMLAIMPRWIYSDKPPMEALAFEESLAELKSKLAAGERVFEGLLERMLLKNGHRNCVELKPDKEMGTEITEREEGRLADAKAAMSDEQIAAVIAETAALKEAQLKEDSADDLATIPSVGLADLRREVATIPSEVTTMDGGGSLLTHGVPSGGVVYADVLLDLAKVPMSELPLLSLFTRLLVETGTSELDAAALQRKIGAKTGGIAASTLSQLRSGHGKIADPFDVTAHLAIRGKGTGEKVEELFDLMHSVLVDANLGGAKEKTLEVLKESKARLESGFVSAGNRYAGLRLGARRTLLGLLEEECNGVSYYETLKGLLDTAENDWPALEKRLEALRATLLAQDALVINLTGDDAVLPAASAAAAAFAARLPATPAAGAHVGATPWREAASLLPTQDEAFAITTQVNYVAAGAQLVPPGEEVDMGAMAVVARYLSSGYLWDNVRVVGGAYGGGCALNPLSGAFAFSSYRDPNLQGTLDTYYKSAEVLAAATAELSDEALEKAIVGAVGDLDSPMNAQQKGFQALAWHLSGTTTEERQKYRDGVLNCDRAAFVALADRLKAAKFGAAVFGAADALEKANAGRDSKLSVTKLS